MPGFEDEVSAAMADLDLARSLVAGAHRAAEQQAATVRSKDRSVSVTVDAQGKIRTLTFHGDAYRRLAAAELSTILMETVEQARQESKEDVMASLRMAAGDEADLQSSFDMGAAEELLVKTLLDHRGGATPADADIFERFRSHGR